jgi:uncharacterized protein with HEPN domain
MQLEVRERLQHILDAGEKILQFTSGRTFEEYEENEILRYGIERLFTIVGEALRESGRLEPSIADQVTNYRRIVDFRNILVHGYAEVYDEGVWRIIRQHLPLLLQEVRALLGPNPA